MAKLLAGPVWLMILVLITPTSAEVTTMLSYQGYLTDGDGAPLDGNYQMTFTIYDDPNVTTAWLWQEEYQASNPVAVVDGGVDVTKCRTFRIRLRLE